MVSVIIPTYNEAGVIARALDRLGHVRGSFEVWVVDGRSTDDTCARVNALIPVFPRPLRLVQAARNRALQLNQAAELARGRVLLFLHADTLLPLDAIESLEGSLQDRSIVGGNFDLAFEGRSLWSRLFTWVNRKRRRLGIYYGDSGLFVRRETFLALGGFKPMPLMDDYEFVLRLEKAGRTACLAPVIVVSDRRWRVQGVFRTLLSWVVVQALYSLGLSPKLLVWCYPPVRDHSETQPAGKGSASPQF